MYKKLSFQQNNSNDWLEWRKTVITATDTSIIMNCNRYTSREMLWLMKLNLAPEAKSSKAMNLGTINEPIARNKFIEVTGIQIEPVVIVSSKHQFMGASLDGLSLCGTISVEIKCSKKIFTETSNDIIDDCYKWQMTHQMIVTGHKEMYFIAYLKDEIIVKLFKRNEKAIEELLINAKLFYDCLINFEIPEDKLFT